jgi:hypothetical protein
LTAGDVIVITVTISTEAAAVKAVPTPGTSPVVVTDPTPTGRTFESNDGRPEGVSRSGDALASRRRASPSR